MKKESNWSKEETIVAFYVYCIVPFASSSKTNQIIIKYANMLGRTPSALNMKIGNIGRLDPELKKKKITGLTHGAKMEELVWEEFNNDKESLVYEAEKSLKIYLIVQLNISIFNQKKQIIQAQIKLDLLRQE